MKKFNFFIFSLLLFFNSFSQTDYRKNPALGLSFFGNDFKTAADIRANSLATVLREKRLFRGSNINAGIALSYLEGLGRHTDFIGTFGSSLPGYDLNFLEATGSINFKLLTDNYFAVPYIDLGIGAAKYGAVYNAFLPVGIGLQFNLFDETFLLINSQYRIPVTEDAAYHLHYSIGFTGTVYDRRKHVPKIVELPPPPSDRDNDGIVDSADACPDQAGPASLNGCPDRDSDSIADRNDSCPDVAGIAKYQGCPIPDKDKDGINDEEDKCPDIAGVARYQGCPIPDTDSDGVNDEEDKCPNQAGPAANFGCPVIDVVIVEKVNKAAKNIFFATGSAKLLAKSYPSLNNVVTILNDNPTYKVDVDGHTDTTGSADKNQVLSESRANSVKAYLTSKGVEESRITATGYGLTQPIASNKTAAGRAKNRRVEMKLRNY